MQVLELEGKEQGDWGFKALKQMIKINFRLVCSIVGHFILQHCTPLL
jgi:hypothetical protein